MKRNRRRHFEAAARLCAVASVIGCSARTARAEAPPRRLSLDPTGLWGGSTLGNGNAVWIRPSAGFDFNAALVAAEVGYGRALLPQLDVSLAVGTNVGFATAYGGTLRGKWAAFRWRNFRLAAELPLTLSSYPSDDSPALFMLGAEPGVMMSTEVGRHFGVFYGAALRLYTAESTYFMGPMARAGAGFASGGFRLALGANLSKVLVTATPAMTLFSVDLSLAYLFEGP